MGTNIATAIVYEHEMAKSDDFRFGFESLIRNAAILDRMLISTDIDYVVGGMVIPDTAALGIRIEKMWANGLSLDLPVYNQEIFPFVPITPATGNSRIDTVQVRGIFEEYDEQRRAFYNPDTETGQFFDKFTKERLIIQCEIKQGIAGHNTAPEADTGWLKLAEIVVSPGVTLIDPGDIHNVTAIHQGEENPDWTTQKARTFAVVPSQTLQTLFLINHTTDGQHGNAVIKKANIDFGIGANQVNGKSIPLGENINAGTDTFLSTDSLFAAFVKEIGYRRGNVANIDAAISAIGFLISDMVHEPPADEHLYGMKNRQWIEIVLPDDRGGDSVKSYKFYSDKSISMTNATIADRRQKRYDIGLPFISPLSEVFHFDTDFKNQNQTSSITLGYTVTPILVGREDSNGQIFLNPAVLDIAPYENPGKSIYGHFSIAAKIPTVNSTVEFWLRLPVLDNVEVFHIKTPANEEFAFILGGQDLEYSVAAPGDIPYSVPEEGDPPYSAAEITHTRIEHKSPKGAEVIDLSDVPIYINSWVHVAFVATATNFSLFIGNTHHFDVAKHYQSAQDADILINDGRDTINIDELMIDRIVALAISAFIENSFNHIPYAPLDYREKWAVLMFDNPNKIVTNLFESEQFRMAVLAAINNT